MSKSMNEVWLIGRLTDAPEMTGTHSGKKVAKFNLVVDRDFTNSEGEYDTDFIKIETWGKKAENCERYLGKGRLVSVKGRLQIDPYTDNQGIRRKDVKVVAEKVTFLDKPKESDR